MKHATKSKKFYASLSRKISLGLASGLLFVGFGQCPSPAFAYPGEANTGIYSSTGNVADGTYTVETGTTVEKESAGGAVVNPTAKTASATNNILTVNGSLHKSGYGGYVFRNTIAEAMASGNILNLSGTIKVSADDDNLYGAFGGYANTALTAIPVGSETALTATASGNKIIGTGDKAMFHFVTNFSTVQTKIEEVDQYDTKGTISPKAGLELKSALTMSIPTRHLPMEIHSPSVR